MIGLWIVLGVVAVVGAWLIATYNGLIKSRNQVDEAWSDIDVQLKRRYDLIPNLVNSVKGYMTHEKELLEQITAYRSQAMTQRDAGNTAQLGQTEGMLSGLLGKLQIAVEAYPDLKANENVSQLMGELTDTEDKIQASRRFYNGNVRDFNTKVQVFPTNLIAGIFGFKDYEFFEIENEEERENIEVQL